MRRVHSHPQHLATSTINPQQSQHMKNLIFLLAGLLMVCSLHAQEDQAYQIRATTGDGTSSECKAIVIAPSGLKLRSRPDFKSTTTVVIPFGKEVSYGCDASLSQGVPMVYDADSIAGAWLRVFWRGYHGYAFSGYLGNGILKMDKPFYLLAEESAWCWDDSYISSDYNYYGVYPNADTTSFIIKKMRPVFYSRFEYGIGGITFTLQQPKPSWFAFASREPFSEGKFPISKPKPGPLNIWNGEPDQNKKTDIPRTNWEIKIKMDTIQENDDTPDVRQRLIIRDKKTGTWQYLFDRSIYFHAWDLKWTGDIDGDGISDFMLDISTGHDGGMMLFLSRNPGKWKFVKLAGMYFWGDCC